MDHLSSSPADWTAARERAEEARDDARLLLWRSLEVAGQELPPVIDGARRDRLLAADALSTTWEGWDTKSGARVLLRCIRPAWRRDPVLLRRMARALQSPDPPLWLPDGAWPHLRVEAPGALLLDRYPVEDPADALLLARVLVAGLTGLARLHDAGLVHGGPLAVHMVEGRDRVRLLWLDHFAPEGGPARDLAELGRTVASLDPDLQDPIASLALDWAEDPPPSAEDGKRLVQRLLASRLLETRHRLELTRRRSRRQLDTTRLATLARRLAAAVPPPAGRYCLRADPGGVFVLAESDGREVRGGAAADLSARFLPVIYTPDRGLDASAARALLRAWARRQDGDRARQAEIQAALGGSEAGAALLVRWMSAVARLRTLRRVMGDRRE